MNIRPLISALMLAAACCRMPEPYGPVPTEAQLEWQRLERTMFVHFGPNTFSGKEWGDGTEPEDMFNPTDLDCRQWARTARDSGFRGIIITAKHHDGFCLWPNPASTHTVAHSSWRGGEGDVLRELSDACREYGLEFGVYISPWDRNDPAYGTPEYNDVYVKTLQSVHDGRYGDISEHWFDGANGEGPNGRRQEYDWSRFHETIRSLQPRAVMFSDVGPGCRWCGNEQGVGGRTNWSTLDITGFEPGAGAPPLDTLNSGNVHGEAWVPAEVDVSIRPGWFWRSSETPALKSLKALLDIYYASVGRNSQLLLNVPPDTSGRLDRADSLRLREFGSAIEEIFSEDLAAGASAEASSVFSRRCGAGNVLDGDYDTYWAAGSERASLTFRLPEERTFNRILLQEYIPLGQRIAAFSAEALLPDGTWKTIASETTVGYKRIVPVETVTASAVRINIDKSYAPPVLNAVGLYMDKIYDTL